MKSTVHRLLRQLTFVAVLAATFAPAVAHASNYSVGNSNSTYSNPPPPPPPPPPPRRPTAVIAVRG
jgi:hypothetical protein